MDLSIVRQHFWAFRAYWEDTCLASFESLWSKRECCGRFATSLCSPQLPLSCLLPPGSYRRGRCRMRRRCKLKTQHNSHVQPSRTLARLLVTPARIENSGSHPRHRPLSQQRKLWGGEAKMHKHMRILR